MDINTDPSCTWTVDLDMINCSSPGWYSIIVLASSGGHSDLCRSKGSMSLEPSHGPRCGSRSGDSTLPLMATGASDNSWESGSLWKEIRRAGPAPHLRSAEIHRVIPALTWAKS